jgi:hypothetical protein
LRLDGNFKQVVTTTISPQGLTLLAAFSAGYTTTLTLGNTKKADLIVAHLDGRTVLIDAKSLKNTTNWPLMPKLIPNTHLYVLVSYRNLRSFMRFTVVIRRTKPLNALCYL